MSYPLVSSPDPSTATTSSYDNSMQHTLSSGSTASTANSSVGYSTTSQPQPTLHKARSRHFDMFQNSATIANSSASISSLAFQPYQMPQAVQSQAQGQGQYGYIDQYGPMFQEDSRPRSFQQYNQFNWMNMNVNNSMPYARFMEHSPPLGPNDVNPSFGFPPSSAQYSPPGSLSPTKSETLPAFTLPPLPTSENLIPNAVVIKSIPFAVSSDEFIDIILAAGVPRPYAFNYHIDDRGKFRGLAFANFSTVDDARLALTVLNGFEVYGRKLRAEYKKMLPREERERIERDKRMRRGQLEEQHRTEPVVMQPNSGALDFNNQVVIDLYSDLLLFKNRESEEMAMGPLTTESRRIASQIADKLGLGTKNLPDGSLLITKKTLFQQQQHMLLHRQSLSNLAAAAAATGSNEFRRSMHAPLPINPTSTASALLDYKSNSTNAMSPLRTLRGTKSFADIRSSARNSLYSNQNGSSSSLNNYRAMPAVPDIATALANQIKSNDMHHPLRQPLAPDSSGGFMGLQNSVLRE